MIATQALSACSEGAPGRSAKWTPRAVMGVGAYVSLCVICCSGLPNTLWDEIPRRIVIVIGALGLWRFSWWACHVIRAWLFLHVVFPKKRQEAQALWDAGRRPKRLHIMATTFRERADVTTQVVRSIIREVKASGLPTTIWLGFRRCER